MADITRIAEIYRTAKPDYQFAVDGTEDDARLILKRRYAALTEVERTILVLYAETASYRELGKLFGVSRQTMASQIQNIRQKLTL